MAPEQNYIKKLIRSKWRKICERTELLKQNKLISNSINNPTFEDVEHLFDIVNTELFVCYYCNRKLMFHTTYPNHNAPSIEHKKPLMMGGDNSKENLVLSCHRCNMVKGTMLSDTFQELLKRINDDSFVDKMASEMFLGRFANKLQRCDIEFKQEE
jgi:5-methylcytosine-specific restriction endonuclease McrA